MTNRTSNVVTITTQHFKLSLTHIAENITRINQSLSLRSYEGRYESQIFVVVGAGPSLDDDLMLLCQHRPLFFVIATDCALIPLLKAGVTPDWVVSIDMMPAIETMFLPLPSDFSVPLLTAVYMRPETLKKYPGPVYFFQVRGLDDKEYQKRARQISIDVPAFYEGGNVGYTATVFSLFLGAKTVIFLGMDLAYGSKKMYCDNVCIESPFVDLLTEIQNKNPEIVAVTATDGRKRYTNKAMLLYCKTLGELTRLHPGCRFVNVSQASILTSYWGRLEMQRFETVIDRLLQGTFPNMFFQESPRPEVLFRYIAVFFNTTAKAEGVILSYVRYLLESGDTKTAHTILLEVFDKIRECGTKWWLAGHLDWQAAQYDGALRAFYRALELEPDFPVVLRDLSLLLRKHFHQDALAETFWQRYERASALKNLNRSDGID